YTTVDLAVQKAAEDAVAKVLDHPNDPSVSLVAIDPKDGHIKAMMGGRDYFATGEDDPCIKIHAINADGSPKACAKVNVALGQGGGGAGRQSGSAFKPFVLATALGKGKRLTDIYQASACIDIPKADAGRTWHVCNYEDEAFGPTTVREATYRSINTVYAQIVMDVGPKDSVQTAEKMGICETTRPLLPETKSCALQAVPSAVLGTNVVSPLDMASAFTTFPNLGTHVRPVSITRITDARGHELWKSEGKKTDAINPAVAFTATQALQDVIIKGTASRSGQIGRPAFGKTGTAQEWRDAWFVGGAGTDLVAAVTVYWPDGEIEMKPSCSGRRTEYKIAKDSKGAPLAIPPECRVTRVRMTGGSFPTQIWQLFMLKALEGVPASTFPVPSVELVSVQIDSKRGCLPNPYTPKQDIAVQQFIKGTEPTAICTEPTGPTTAIVPNVTGFPEAEAVKLLRDAGFNVSEFHEASRLYPPGRVTRQDPNAGADASAGATVSIWISTATTRAIVPDVVNKSEKEATRILLDAGFNPKVVQRDHACKPNDQSCIVRDQTPNGGESADRGSDVLLTIGPSG
ncbi:MAG: PASTA domain-containing protein, partial [Actinomycetota bacterium]